MALMACLSISERIFIYPPMISTGIGSILPNHLSTSYTGNSAALFCRNGSRNAGPVQVRAMAATFGARMEEGVKKTVAANPVVIYSKTWCSYSSEVISLLKRLGVEHLLVIDLDQLGPQGPQLQKTLLRLTGQRTVPNVFIGGKHVGGCIDTVKLHRKGELQLLLLEAGVVKLNIFFTPRRPPQLGKQNFINLSPLAAPVTSPVAAPVDAFHCTTFHRPPSSPRTAPQCHVAATPPSSPLTA